MRKSLCLVAIICFVLTLVGVSTFLRVENKEVFAANTTEELCYVSLGDSIAAGHSLSGHSESNQYGYSNNTSTKIVDGCYTQLFSDSVLKSYYPNVKTISFAKSGQTSAGLLEKLQKDANVRTAVQKADVVTVYIGANDLLSVLNSDDAALNMVLYLADIKDDLIRDLEKGIETCANNYPKIVETLNSLNPNAKILFNTVFNPFRELKETNSEAVHWVSIPSDYAPSWYWDDWYTIPFSGSILVNIGTKTDTLLNKLNKVIKNSVTSLNNPNHCVVDVKAEFDKASYDYIFCDIVSKSKKAGAINTDNLNDHTDVHPTLKGQNGIFKAIESVFKNKFTLLQLEGLQESASGANLVRLHNKNQLINPNELVAVYGNNNDQLFGGWFKDLSLENLWDFEKDVVVESTTLYAKWSSLVCSDEQSLNQFVNATNNIEFNIDVQMDVEWFVNGEKQTNISGKIFSFNPTNDVIGQYVIECKIGDYSSNNFIVNVEYYVPTNLSIKSEKVADDLYVFSVDDENALSIDPQKLVWYKEQNEEVSEVGKGTEIELKNVDGCNVFVKYLGDDDIESNMINIEPSKLTPINQHGDRLEKVNNFVAKHKIEVITVGAILSSFLFVLIVAETGKRRARIKRLKNSLIMRLVKRCEK